MKAKKGKAASLFLAVLLAAALFSGCRRGTDREIVILFTNDVHCGAADDIGYAGLAAYKKSVEERTPYTLLADCGDSIQGDVMGTVSEGEYPAMLMKRAGYDFAVPGNHEFDYGIDRLTELAELTGAQYLACNIRYSGGGDNPLDDFAPYAVKRFGGTKLAFIGICTPESITASSPSSFMDENGTFVYDFYGGGDGGELYGQVQRTVDACRRDGADYVIALAHLGVDEALSPFASVDVIQNTSGIDAVLDGHSHSVIPCRILKNKEGKEVLLSSTGTKLDNIGQLVIMPGGNITVGLISDYPDRDPEMSEYIEEITAGMDADLARTVAKGEAALSISENGIRIVRSRETAIGDLCADAFRESAGADAALLNGGGIRDDLPAGEITYGDIISVFPYGNTLCKVKASGAEILDALEMACRFVQSDYGDGENAVGENGGFLQVSGLRYTVDTSLDATVETDENGMFLQAGVRRVRDVEILQNGVYVPIEPDGIYTVASHNYLIKEGGDGLNMFLDNELIIDEGTLDSQVLISYIRDHLGGTIGKEYAAPQNRITIK